MRDGRIGWLTLHAAYPLQTGASFYRRVTVSVQYIPRLLTYLLTCQSQSEQNAERLQDDADELKSIRVLWFRQYLASDTRHEIRDDSQRSPVDVWRDAVGRGETQRSSTTTRQRRRRPPR